jgi:hypothetical protein
MFVNRTYKHLNSAPWSQKRVVLCQSVSSPNAGASWACVAPGAQQVNAQGHASHAVVGAPLQPTAASARLHCVKSAGARLHACPRARGAQEVDGGGRDGRHARVWRRVQGWRGGGQGCAVKHRHAQVPRQRVRACRQTEAALNSGLGRWTHATDVLDTSASEHTSCDSKRL